MRALRFLILFSLINLFCFPTRPQASRPEKRAGTSFTQQAKSAEPNFSSSKTKD